MYYLVNILALDLRRIKKIEHKFNANLEQDFRRDAEAALARIQAEVRTTAATRTSVRGDAEGPRRR